MHLLMKSQLRHIRHHPFQGSLAVLGIALGVAVVIAIDLANSRIVASVEDGEQQLSRGYTHRVVGLAGRRIPESVYRDLRLAGHRSVSPLVADLVELTGERSGNVQLIGIDPFADVARLSGTAGIGFGPAGAGELLTNERAVVLVSSGAGAPAIDPGEVVQVRFAQRSRQLEVVATVDLADGSAEGAWLVGDLATVQEVLGRGPYLDHLNLDPDERLGDLETALGPEWQVLPTGQLAAATVELSDAFRLNLRALSLLALAVGFFIIFSTMHLQVVRRLRQFGRLRCVGVTSREILWTILGESLVLGILGTALGIGFGYFLADTLTALMSRTTSELYADVGVFASRLRNDSTLKATVLGLGTSVLGGIQPALRASRVSPQILSQRITQEALFRGSRWWHVGAATTAAGALSLVVWNWTGLTGAFGAIGLSLVCAICLMRWWVAFVVAVLRPVSSHYLYRMAVIDNKRLYSRFGWAMVALMVALATTNGIASMVSSFRTTLTGWLADRMSAEIYVAGGLAEEGPTMTQQLAAIADLDLVADATAIHRARLFLDGRFVSLTAVSVSPALERAYPLEARTTDTWARFAAGDILVSEPLANKLAVGAGDSLDLRTLYGEHAFTIAGVFYEYGDDKGNVLMSMTAYGRHFGEAGVAALAVKLAHGTYSEGVAAIRERLPELRDHYFVDQGMLLRAAHETFDRTFSATDVLRHISLVVAVLGLFSALTSLHLERKKDLDVLRAIGFGRMEIGVYLLGQALVFALIVALIAIPLGETLSLLMVKVLNLRAFGWTLSYHVDGWLALETLGWAMIATVLASIYPLWRLLADRTGNALQIEYA